ncbi:MAG: cytosine permease [Sulfolobaceae archaeon]|nr:cytosine permease [Sulfolobaceae archaeon]
MEQIVDRLKVTHYDKARGQVELSQGFSEEKYLWNEDFHPTPLRLRNWGPLTYASLWFSMVAIVPTWALAVSGLALGLNWIQSLFIVFLGNAIVLIPMIIQSHAGARYGIAEPQLTRVRWGVYGAIIPSWIRAIIGMGWWGIESYIIAEASVAMYLVASNRASLLTSANAYSLALTYPHLFWITFSIVILAQILVYYFSPPTKAQPAMKALANVSAPIILASYIYLFIYTMNLAHWNFAPIMEIPTRVSGLDYWLTVIAFLNANIAYWATMALSMPDYTRFAKSQKAHILGQVWMPFMMLGIATLGTFSVGATMALGVNHGEGIQDPIILTAVLLPGITKYLVLFGIILATFVVNVFANAAAPGYDIANSFPKRLSWFKGILIGILIGTLLGAWTFYAKGAYSYITNWLLTYGTVLGAVEGIIIFDYAIIRRFKFDLADVFLSNGRYKYWKGVNPAAIISFVIAAIVTYLYYWHIIVNPITQLLFENSWLSAFLISGVVYIILMALWIIPKYQPDLKGNLLRGYYSQDTIVVFNLKQK